MRARDTRQHRKVDFSVLRPLLRHTPSTTVKIELFNTQSLTNKSGLIHDHILDKRIDIMCLSETWHRPEVYLALNEACPPGYIYHEKARSTGRGGGLAILHRDDLELTPLPLPKFSSFECLAAKCNPPRAMTILVIYRPPKPNPAFVPELHDLLTTLCATSTNMVILGDMNIHVDTPSCHSASELLQLLDSVNLTQHVDVPTHSKGHTLDLVITDSAAPITNLLVYDLGVSDHMAVSMEILFPSPHSKPKRQICFRNIKNINQDALARDLQHLTPPTLSTVGDSVGFYNTTLSGLLDVHAPVKTRTVTFSRSAPWFTSELREMKVAGRVLERRFLASGLTVHKVAYREHQKAYSKALKDARSKFYSETISNSPGNSKQLFSTIHSLLKPQTQVHRESTEKQCNDFMSFFRTKVEGIRSLLPGSSTPPAPAVVPQLEVSQPLCCFDNTSQQEVQRIIRRMKSSTCALDPFPTALVKANIGAIGPLITNVINLSLQAGHVPPALKTAIITPLLKRPTLDPEALGSYRPISNLPFLSKVLEKVVAAQLQTHLEDNNIFEKFQSGFRSAHSTETALVRVTNDLLMAADDGCPSLLVLLDLSAAFDTVDHAILLDRLHSTVGLCDLALSWFQSYLAGRTECVSLGGAKSSTQPVTCGVPQGSVLGPLLFTLYMLPLGRIISRHGVSFHCYADDTQLYIRTEPTPPTALSSSPSPAALSACLEETKAWMNHNFLQLNSSKTEAMLVGTPHQVRSSPITSITFAGQVIPLSTAVTNLGVRMDPTLTFDTHIKHLCKTSFYHLRNIAKLRPTLSLSDAEKLVHAFVSSRLDYCNALLIGIPSKSIQKLQYIQNSAARILMRVRKFDHITPILESLHWLPVELRIQYKISLLTHQCLHGNAPAYLKELLVPQTSSRTLRSSTANLLRVPRTKLCSIGDRAFCSAAPSLWNALPDHLRAPQTVDSFKRSLKTHLFKKAFP